MTFGRLLRANLLHHWRANLAVLLGVAVGCAVLTGALLVGDSLRGSLRALADFRNQRIGFVFQEHHLLPQCSVLENVLVPTLVSRGDPGQTRAWALKLLDRVGLSNRLEHRPAELSGGERQRVAVARALIQRPLLVLADEPTGNLDRASAREVGRLLLELHREQDTILVVVTHSAELAEGFPRTLRMDDGCLGAAPRPVLANLDDTVQLPPEPGTAS